MAGVWIFAENHTQGLELLNTGRILADKTGSRLLSFLWHDHQVAEDYLACGADEVLLLPPLEESQPLEAYIPVIVDELREGDADIFLLAATLRGKDLAARIASRLDTGLCSDCISLKLDEDNTRLEMERLVFGGAGIQKVFCSSRPQMATIPPGTFEAAVPANSRREGKIRELPSSPATAVKILEKKAKERKSANIKEARRVVCVGRGIEKEEDLAMVREFAQVLGAEIACTRPVSEEMRWLPEDLCIGLSGIEIKPDLYIGLGISGQVQHVIGIRDSKIICAVNSDENAPIFDVADYGIVGDLYDVLPRLHEELGKLL